MCGGCFPRLPEMENQPHPADCARRRGWFCRVLRNRIGYLPLSGFDYFPNHHTFGQLYAQRIDSVGESAEIHFIVIALDS